MIYRMIEAEVHRNNELIMARTYNELGLSLDSVIAQMEIYVKNEQLNLEGECLLRARFILQAAH